MAINLSTIINKINCFYGYIVNFPYYFCLDNSIIPYFTKCSNIYFVRYIINSNI